MTEPYYRLHAGHVIDVLRSLEADSVNCVVTSPPYWSLRKYDAPDVVWGGTSDCSHVWAQGRLASANMGGGATPKQATNVGSFIAPERAVDSATCSRCGAWRGQYGLEPTPELYVEHSMMVLREIRRVLRPDGVVFWNIGDGYSGSWGNFGARKGEQRTLNEERLPREAWDNFTERPATSRPHATLKPKDLVLMPERIALAAQADGWWVRSRVIWQKPNAMPESVRDRPTNCHETIWMLTKSARYWWDAEAVREPLLPASVERNKHGWNGNEERDFVNGPQNHFSKYLGSERAMAATGRNIRDVWTFSTAQTPEAHFATFPLALPTRCIQAACPKEVCATCGKARERMVESQWDGRADSATKYTDEHKAGPLSRSRQRYREHGREGPAPAIERGWTDCGHDNYQPGLVLDPFAGLATTGIAALRLGRRFVGSELSEKYAELARKKLSLWWQDAKIVEGQVPDAQAVLPLEIT